MGAVNRKWGRLEAYCKRRGIDPALAKARIETGAAMSLAFASLAYLAAR